MYVNGDTASFTVIVTSLCDISLILFFLIYLSYCQFVHQYDDY